MQRQAAPLRSRGASFRQIMACHGLQKPTDCARFPKESPIVTAQPDSTSPKPPRSAGEPAAPPRVWLLTGQRAGDRAQILALAEALGWPFEEKRLAYNRRYKIPNLLLGASRLSLEQAASSPLAAPWPDLVIASGRRSAPIARWIRRRSGGRCRLVHIGRPWVSLRHFDLVVSTPQYGLPSRPSVVQNILSLNRVDPLRLEAAATTWTPRLADLPKPMIALIVGGDARPFALDREAAVRLGSDASRLAAQQGASLVVTTSPRTRPEAVEALFAAISVPCFRHNWADGGENPYLAFLALSESLIVTGDSASMLSEACATGKPLWIFELPEKLDRKMRSARRFRRLAKGRDGLKGGWLARLYDWFVDLGLVKSTRDMQAFHENLIARGLAAKLGDAHGPTGSAVFDDLEQTARRVRVLMSDPGP